MLVNPIQLSFDESQEGTYFLAFEIKKSVELQQVQIYDLISQVLYKPASNNDIGDWIKKVLEKGLKDFEPGKIRKKLAQIVKEEVNVLANGKNYETMSLGEKSIYGIEYKLRESAGETLFLDQPRTT
ncbi:hypothetical protein [Mycoplasma sp. ATU-Cv-508]|uniref:hypothetical protein n=1 Tax=Mycoplasma sp. ATU-Cv-508 TaxID=2048001 RepID=UPI000FDD2462